MSNIDLKKELEKKRAKLEQYRKEKQRLRLEKENEKKDDLNVKSPVDLRDDVNKMMQSVLGINLTENLQHEIENKTSKTPENSTEKSTVSFIKYEPIDESVKIPTLKEIKPPKTTILKTTNIQRCDKEKAICYDRSCQTDEYFQKKYGESDINDITVNSFVNNTISNVFASTTESPNETNGNIAEMSPISTTAVQNDQDDAIENNVRFATEEEYTNFCQNDGFLKFMRRAGTVLERLLSCQQDTEILVDYELSDSAGSENGELKRAGNKNNNYYHRRRSKHSKYYKSNSNARDLQVSRVFSLDSVKANYTRPVIDIAWSPHYPELVAVSYVDESGKDNYGAYTSSVFNHEGLVMVWNLKFPKKTPEYTFTCQSRVLSVMFATFHPNLVIGGTYSGQLVLWDMRSNYTHPIQQSCISSTINAYHTNPIYCLNSVGSGDNQNLVSISTNGVLCTWNMDMLSKPIESIKLVTSNRSSISAICSSFTSNDHNNFFLGGDQGSVYHASFHDNCQNITKCPSQQDSTITCIDCHPLYPEMMELSDYFLTTSFDWSLDLWSASQKRPIHSFNCKECTCFFYDAQWSPTHPTLFCCCSDVGKLAVWDLSKSFDTPVAISAKNTQTWDNSENEVRLNNSLSQVESVLNLPNSNICADSSFSSISKVKWNHSGTMIAAGDNKGAVCVYNIPESINESISNESLKSTLKHLEMLSDVGQIDEKLDSSVFFKSPTHVY